MSWDHDRGDPATSTTWVVVGAPLEATRDMPRREGDRRDGEMFRNWGNGIVARTNVAVELYSRL